MAFLIDPKQTTRLVPPNAPEDWIEVRRVMAGDLEAIEVTGSGLRVSLELMAKVVLAWSDPAPVSLESLRRLDLDTMTWLSTAILEASGVRSPDEKKDSSASSSSTSPLTDREPSLVSSPT